jgi:hypothetical protein
VEKLGLSIVKVLPVNRNMIDQLRVRNVKNGVSIHWRVGTQDQGNIVSAEAE